MTTVFQGRVFSVEVGQRRYPDGRVREVAIVRHRPSVVIVPIRDDGRVVLVRQFRASVNRQLWELPAGGVEPGETPDDAVARECEEEIGLRPTRIERVRGLFPAPGFCDEELLFYRASGLQPPPPDSPHRPDDDEDIQSEAFALDEAREMVTRGDIVDLKTAYGLMLV